MQHTCNEFLYEYVRRLEERNERLVIKCVKGRIEGNSSLELLGQRAMRTFVYLYVARIPGSGTELENFITC